MHKLFVWSFNPNPQVDAFKPDFERHPLARGLPVYEGILNPGEVIFIPETWPHAVYNLDDIVAASGNFVDHHKHVK